MIVCIDFEFSIKIRRGTERSECLRACRSATSRKSQSNPNPSPLGEGFMPPPYPLHGSGSLRTWSALPRLRLSRAIGNRSYFLIVFRCHFGSILGPIWEPFGTLFGIKIGPSSVQVAFLSFIFFKNMIFTKPFKTNEF